jgi:hypothetical protein
MKRLGSRFRGGAGTSESRLLLEIDRRGLPTALGAAEGGRDPTFPAGAIVAAWGRATAPEDSRPGLSDLVELARYALA